jgi:hypothetical protein
MIEILHHMKAIHHDPYAGQLGLHRRAIGVPPINANHLNRRTLVRWELIKPRFQRLFFAVGQPVNDITLFGSATHQHKIIVTFLERNFVQTDYADATLLLPFNCFFPAARRCLQPHHSPGLPTG